MVQSLHEIIGCIHIHSTYSDGTGTIPEIARIAEEVGLNFIMMTDHNNLRALTNGEEKWYGSVLAIIGYEINDIDDTNHYLAFGLNEEVDRNLPAPQYVHQVKLNGGFGIIAHPDESRNVMVEHPPYPWTAWESDDYQGIEIWNQMSEWMEGLTPWNKVWRFVNPRRSIDAPNEQTLQRWDEVNQQRKVAGIGGVDAHAHKHRMIGGLIELTVFRYKVQFQTVRTHLLLTKPLLPGLNVEEVKKLVYDAILNCRIYVSNFYTGDAKGFLFWAENEQGKAHIGGNLVYQQGTNLHTHLPSIAQVRLIRNGQEFRRQEGKIVHFEIDQPGFYRVEVFRKNRAWIYSNHIRITGE
ncbi:MAG: PHP domain-containing protein [Calditrichia bacterium]|nr:PHP domain-containing protein [Calditrichia bacterium]